MTSLHELLSQTKENTTMKTYHLLLFNLFSLIALSAAAQNSGVYNSAADFKSGKLTYEINCSTEKHKIKLNEFLNKDYITVIHNKQPHNLSKKEIFGYKDCNGITYRFIDNSHFEVLNPTEEILIFKHVKAASKNQQAEIHYYFGLVGSDQVAKLTLNNLKSAFPDNHKLHDALDAEFKGDDELALYDSFHKMFKINRLYAANK